MSASATDLLLDHLATPPSGLDDVIELFHRAANAKKSGKPRKKERVTREHVKQWLLGTSMLTEDERVLLDCARRSAIARGRFRVLMREMRAPAVSWRAPDGGRE